MRKRRGGVVAVVVSCRTAYGQGRAQEVVVLPVLDRAIEARFEEVYRVGGQAARDWELLSDVTSLGFDQRGRLFVGDIAPGSGLRIVVVKSDGTLERTFGRAGQGPGEFMGAVEMVVLEHGRVAVPDFGRDMIHVFGSDGHVESMFPIPKFEEVEEQTRRRAARNILVPDRAGGVLWWVSEVVEMRISEATWTMTMTQKEGPRRVLRLTFEDQRILSHDVFEGWTPEGAGIGRTMSMTGEELELGMEAGTSPALLPKFLFTALPDGGVAWSESAGYAIRVADRDGRVQRVLRRDLPARPIDDRVARDYKAWLMERLEGETDPEISDLQRRRIEALSFYPEVPQVDGVRATWEGTLWILRTPGDGWPWSRDETRETAFPIGEEWLRLNRQPAPIDVVTKAGRYVGTFVKGATTMPVAFGPDGLAAWVELDDFDVPTVIVRRLFEEVR